MGKSRGLRLFILICGLIVLAGCADLKTVEYSQFEHIDEEGWDPAVIFGFAPAPLDTTLSASTCFSLVLTFRYGPDCKASEIPVMISEQGVDGEFSSQVRKVKLRDADGSHIGQKGLVLYEISDTIRNSFEIPDNYWVELGSLAPTEYTRGLKDVGLELIKN